MYFTLYKGWLRKRDLLFRNSEIRNSHFLVKKPLQKPKRDLPRASSAKLELKPSQHLSRLWRSHLIIFSFPKLRQPSKPLRHCHHTLLHFSVSEISPHLPCSCELYCILLSPHKPGHSDCKSRLKSWFVCAATDTTQSICNPRQQFPPRRQVNGWKTSRGSLPPSERLNWTALIRKPSLTAPTSGQTLCSFRPLQNTLQLLILNTAINTKSRGGTNAHQLDLYYIHSSKAIKFPYSISVKSLLENETVVRMCCQKGQGTACNILKAATLLGRPEPEWAPAGTSRHVWPKLCIVFHTLLVKLCNSLPQDPGSLLVGGHQMIHRTGKMTNPWGKKG